MLLCKVDELEEGTSKGFYFDNEETIFLLKQDGEIFGYKNSCPHLGVPLEMQPDTFLDLDNAFIQCSTHGALFEMQTGLCVAGPCKGASLTGVPIKLENGDIYLDK